MESVCIVPVACWAISPATCLHASTNQSAPSATSAELTTVIMLFQGEGAHRGPCSSDGHPSGRTRQPAGGAGGSVGSREFSAERRSEAALWTERKTNTDMYWLIMSVSLGEFVNPIWHATLKWGRCCSRNRAFISLTWINEWWSSSQSVVLSILQIWSAVGV